MMDLPGRLVLVGHPVSHSLSPRFQNAALRRFDASQVAAVGNVAPLLTVIVLADARPM